MAKETRHIRIEVDSKGNEDLKRIADGMGVLNKNIKDVSDTSRIAKYYMGSFFAEMGLGGIKSIMDMSDSITLLSGRIMALSSSTAAHADAMKQLIDLSGRTRSSLESVATIYQRIAAATKSTGYSTSGLIRVTETLSKSFQLSGSTMAEATATAIQLSQGLASGQLRGQELRSVLEQNVIVGDILSKTFNVTRGQLYKLAEQGKITAGQVMVALLTKSKNVDDQYKQMGYTFEQTSNLIKNEFQVALLGLNKTFDVSGNLYRGVQFLIDKLPLVAASLVTTFSPLIIYNIISMVESIGTLSTAIYRLAARNPLIAVMAGISAAIVSTHKDLTDFLTTIEKMIDSIQSLSDRFPGLGTAIKGIASAIPVVGGSLSLISDAIAPKISDSVTAFKTYLEERRKSEKSGSKGYDPSSDIAKAMADAKKQAEGMGKEVTELTKLNDDLAKGLITTSQYMDRLAGAKLADLSEKFKEGKKDIFEYRKEMLEIKRADIVNEFNNGRISVDDFNKSINENKMAELNNKLEEGKINLREFRREMLGLTNDLNAGGALQVGMQDYLESIGTVSQQTAAMVSSAFRGLEDAIFKFTKGGKDAFREMTQAILDDIAKIVIRAQIVAPLAQGLLGLDMFNPVAGSVGGGGSMTAPTRFASGGVVDSPTFFTASGRMNVMGEAGPEAILPLKRGPNGDLGVATSGGGSNVTVNVINNASGTDVQQKSSQGPDGSRQIDILIMSKVKEGFANGSFDRTMQAAYGLRRQGV